MRAIRKRMHIDRADQIAVAGEAAGAADPVSAPGLLSMPTAGTLATCSSFRASRARDVSLFGFVGEILDVFAIFPQRHALIVVSALVRLSDAMRIANEDRPDLVVNTKVNHVPSGLMACITNSRFERLQTIFLVRCSFFQRREYFLHRDCFLASCPTCRMRCRLSERIPRPVTIRACPVFVVTAARWISPRSTVACPVPGGASASGTSTQTYSSKPRFQTRVQAPASSGKARGNTRDFRPLPIGKTTRPSSFETAWAGQWTG